MGLDSPASSRPLAIVYVFEGESDLLAASSQSK